MAEFLLALVTVFAVSFGGRDQLLIARLSRQFSAGGGLLAVGSLVSAASASLMATAGLAIALLLPGAAADMLVAIAFLVAAVELALSRTSRLPEDPTRSLFAIFLVLFMRQVGDAARFCVFAFAAGGSAWLAGGGGALGGACALALGTALAGELETWPLRTVRLTMAAMLLVGAIAVGLAARGIVG